MAGKPQNLLTFSFFLCKETAQPHTPITICGLQNAVVLQWQECQPVFNIICIFNSNNELYWFPTPFYRWFSLTYPIDFLFFQILKVTVYRLLNILWLSVTKKIYWWQKLWWPFKILLISMTFPGLEIPILWYYYISHIH